MSADVEVDVVFVCIPCDASSGITKGKHMEKHTLVKCQTQASKDEPLTLEQRVGKVESGLETINNRLGGVEAQLTRIQQMLLESALPQAAGI